MLHSRYPHWVSHYLHLWRHYTAVISCQSLSQSLPISHCCHFLPVTGSVTTCTSGDITLLSFPFSASQGSVLTCTCKDVTLLSFQISASCWVCHSLTSGDVTLLSFPASHGVSHQLHLWSAIISHQSKDQSLSVTVEISHWDHLLPVTGSVITCTRMWRNYSHKHTYILYTL